MTFRKVRPGLYERTGTPRQVKITYKFAEAVRREGNSTCLETIVDQAVQESDRLAKRQGR